MGLSAFQFNKEKITPTLLSASFTKLVMKNTTFHKHCSFHADTWAEFKRCSKLTGFKATENPWILLSHSCQLACQCTNTETIVTGGAAEYIHVFLVVWKAIIMPEQPVYELFTVI